MQQYKLGKEVQAKAKKQSLEHSSICLMALTEEDLSL